MLISLIILRYTAISVIPAAVGKKVRDIAAKVHILMVIITSGLCEFRRGGLN